MNYKKYILSLGLCGALATSIFAEEKTITGRYTNTNGSRVDITGVSATTDLILNSTPNQEANTGEMFRAKDNVVHTLKAINGTEAGNVNLAAQYSQAENRLGYFTVDVNSDTAITAVDVASLRFNYMNFNIVNSNANASKANVAINFGESLIVDSTSSGQEQNLTIGVAKGTVNAKNTIIGETAKNSSLVISEGANIEWTGSINVGKSGVDRTSKIVIDGNFSLASGTKSNIILNRATSINVGANGSLNIANNTLSINKYASVTVDGNFVTAGGSHVYVNGSLLLNNVNPNNQVKFYWLESSGTFTQAIANKNNGVRLSRKSLFKNGANWTVNEILDLYGDEVKNTSLETTRAYAVMEEGSKMVIAKGEGKSARIRLWGNSELDLYQANAFSDQDGNSIRLATALGEYSKYGSVVRLYSEQTFSDLYITTGSNLEIYLENDLAKLILDGTGNTVTNSTEEGLTIYNFREEAIYVGTKQTTANAIANATFYDGEMNKLQVVVGSNGWLTAVVVPEPAEWAMIFGGIALGLAVYRRRK